MPDPAETPNAERPPTAAEGHDPKPPHAAHERARKEIGGPEGPEPTRYGDWERNGRCTDF